MDTIILGREIEMWLSSLAPVTLVLYAIRMSVGRPKRSGSRRAPDGVSANHGDERPSSHRDANKRARLCLQKTEENEAIVDRLLTSFWRNYYNPAIVDGLAAPDIFFSHSLHLPRIGPVSLKTFMADLREAFPDLSLERTAGLIADGDVVMFRWMCEGTHTGPAFYDLVMGALPDASDRKMRFSGLEPSIPN